jgi:hypothetical protein
MPTLADINKYLKAMDKQNPLSPGDPNWPGNAFTKTWFEAIHEEIVDLRKAVIRLERMAYFGETWSDVKGPVYADTPGGPGPAKTPPPPPPSYPP